MCYPPRMPVKSCRVTICDFDGFTHTAEVTAATLFEAVALGIAALRGNDWVAEVAQGLNVVKVSVADVRVEHEVRLKDFLSWLESPGKSPRDIISREKVRTILGMNVAPASPFSRDAARRSSAR